MSSSERIDPPLTQLGPADRHSVIADRFGDVVCAVTDWAAPTPVKEWQAGDVLDHLLTWFPAFLSSVTPLAIDRLDLQEDPFARWQYQAVQVQDILEGPKAWLVVDDARFGERRLDSLIDDIYTSDIFMHTWDLARSQGLDFVLDPDLSSMMLTGMSAMEATLRASKQYGPAAHPVARSADPGMRLVAFIGRDPDWQLPR